MSQVYAFVDERAIGLPISTLPTQINRVARVAFESAAFYISGMSMATAEAPREPDRQRELAKALIADPDIVEGINLALAAGKGTVVSSSSISPRLPGSRSSTRTDGARPISTASCARSSGRSSVAHRSR